MASGSSSGSITSVGSATLESAELAFPILSAATRASPVRECEFGGATRVPPPTDARPAAGRAPFQPQSRTRCPSQPSKQERKLKPSAHTSAATKLSKRSRATQHPPPFVVRHLDQNDRLPDDLPNPGTARPPPVRSRSSTRQHFTVKHGSDGRATPGLESDARGARGGGRGQDQLAKKNPRVDPREPLHHASSRALDPAIKQFNLQKSEILRFIHRVKAEYPRHIASPYRRTPIPLSPNKVTNAETRNRIPHNHSHSRSPSPPPRGSVRPPSPLNKRQIAPPGSSIPLRSLSRLADVHTAATAAKAITPKRKGGVKLDRKIQQDQNEEIEPFVGHLVREVKRAFPPLEVEGNPRRKRFRAELSKAWTRSFAEGLGDY